MKELAPCVVEEPFKISNVVAEVSLFTVRVPAELFSMMKGIPTPHPESVGSGRTKTDAPEAPITVVARSSTAV